MSVSILLPIAALLLLTRLNIDFIDAYLRSAREPSRVEMNETMLHDPGAYLRSAFRIFGRPRIYLRRSSDPSLNRLRTRMLLGVAVFVGSCLVWFLDTAILRSGHDLIWFEVMATIGLAIWFFVLVVNLRRPQTLVMASAALGIIASLTLLILYR